MSDYTKQLKAEKRAKALRMSAIIGDGTRRLTTSQRQEFDDLDSEIRQIDNRIAIAKSNEYRDASGHRMHRTAEDTAFTSYLRGNSPSPEMRAALDANAMSTIGTEPGVAGATGYSAGYMIPMGFWANLQVALKAYGGVSSAFRQVVTDSGNPMPWPTVDPTAIRASYLTEMNQLGFGGDSQGTDYQFGQGMLNAWTIVSGVILASVQLVNDSAFDVDSFVADRLGEALGRKLAAEAVSGSGSTAGLGVITALNARGTAGTVGGAITATGGFVQLGTASTVKKFDGTSPTELAGNILSPASLLAMVMAVDSAYLPNAAWFMNAQQAWNLRSIADSNNRPIINLENGFTSDPVTGGNYNYNTPVGRLFGFPVIIDNNIPNLTASTTGGPVFGDLSRAMVMRTVRGDARVVAQQGMGVTSTGSMMRLTERYADYLQVGL